MKIKNCQIGHNRLTSFRLDPVEADDAVVEPRSDHVFNIDVAVAIGVTLRPGSGRQIDDHPGLGSGIAHLVLDGRMSQKLLTRF